MLIIINYEEKSIHLISRIYLMQKNLRNKSVKKVAFSRIKLKECSK